MQLSQVQGQPLAVRALERALSARRLAHGYLFVGPEGVGKETTARALAQALLCSSPVDGGGCGSCSPCRKVESGVHPDLHLLAPQKNVIPIDAVRALEGRLQFKPLEGAWKVAIVREAHQLNGAAQNALLKTLEEPPGRAMIVLCTSAPNLLLPTIRSRCQRIVFAPLPDEVIRARIARELDLPADDAGVRLAVALSEGSLGRGLEVVQAQRFADRRELVEAVTGLRRARPAEALDLAERHGRDRTGADEVLELLQIWFRDRLLDGTGRGDRCSLPDLGPQEPMGLSPALDALDILHTSRRALAGFTNPQLCLERAFLSLSASLEEPS